MVCGNSSHCFYFFFIFSLISKFLENKSKNVLRWCVEKANEGLGSCEELVLKGLELPRTPRGSRTGDECPVGHISPRSCLPLLYKHYTK